MPVRLRDLLPEDRDPLRDLLHGTGEFAPEEATVASDLIDERLAGDTDYRFVIAEDGDGLAGYACYGPVPMTDGSWDLYWIVVAPGRRGAGIGAELLRAAEEAVISGGGRMLIIETASKASYAETRTFYEARGYAETARVPDFYSVGDDKVIYRKVF